jgi:Ca-activated chloride channel family protein
MEVAQSVVSDLITSIPDGRRLCFIVYGHNVEQKCLAVEVVQKLAPLDTAIKRKLLARIEQLRPVGHTPIAFSLRIAGAELARAEGNSGLILLTDGMETCHGDPNREAAKLAELPGLKFGIHVVGFDVEPQERDAVEKIAKSGKGKFYDARSAGTLEETVATIQKEIVQAPPPPPPVVSAPEPAPAPAPAPVLDENSPEIQGLIDALQDRDGTVRREAAEGLSRSGLRSQKVIDALKRRVADDLWIPKPRFRGTNNAWDPLRRAARRRLWQPCGN